MLKKILILSIISGLCLTSCQKENEEPSLDFYVNGKVTDKDNLGILNVEILIERAKTNSTTYDPYQIIKTTASGNYSYLIKNDSYKYKI